MKLEVKLSLDRLGRDFRGSALRAKVQKGWASSEER